MNASRRQRGFAAHGGDEIIAQGINFIGDSVEECRAYIRAQVAVDRVRGSRGAGGGIHFGLSGLEEGAGQRFTGGRVEALQLQRAVGAAATADVVVSK
ncbi:hypothetical protein D3C76_1268120 [compost metagenome]